jgi:hypothetical protein
MRPDSYLFDMDPYTPRPRRKPRQMSQGLRQSLARLKRTMDGIPPQEWEARRKRWEALERSLRGK